MTLEGKDEELLRKYLLGELSEPDQQAFEERLLTDDELYDLLLAEEDELVDDYLGGLLSERERERFDSYFLSTPERQRKLSFGEAWKRYEPQEVVPPVLEDPKQNPATKELAVNEPTAKDRVVEDSGAKESASKVLPTALPFPSPVVIDPPPWWSRTSSTPYFKIAATVVIALGLVGTWRGFFYRSPVGEGMAALAQAYRNERPTEARISGFTYAPHPNTRGTDDGKVDTTSRNLAEIILLEEVAKHPSPPAHHTLGRLYLAKREYKLAIEQFEAALKDDPNNAQIHSDYGAALLETGKVSHSKGDSGKSLEEFTKGDEHLSKALELSASLLEALFNRALCREQMFSYRGAEQDWKDYLKKDANSKWADEARERLRDIESRPPQPANERGQVLEDFFNAHRDRADEWAWKLVCENRDLTGSVIEDGLIDRYLDSAANGRDDEARESLVALSYAGDLARLRSGDLFIPSLVRFYRSTTPAQRNEILRARSLTRSGRESFSKNNFNAALESYESAREIFRRLGDSTELIKIDFIIGNSYLQQSRAEEALSCFQPLGPICQRLSFRFLQSQTFYATSGAHQYFRDFSSAMNNTNRAINLAEEMGDAVGVLKARFQLGEINRFVNNERHALDLYFQDLPVALSYAPQAAQLWARYFSISRALDQLGMYSAAVCFQKEALLLAQEARANRPICRSYNYLGFIYAKHGNYADATDCITRALEVGNSFEEDKVRIEATAYSYLQLGYVYRKTGDFNKAIENYDHAIRFYDELNSQFFAFTARKEKLLCCMEHNACPDVEREMETVLNLYEAHRSKILEESNRNTFFDAEQTIYDVAIEFEYFNKGDLLKAFEYSEKSRGRSLSDMTSASIKLVDNANTPDVEFGEVSKTMSVDEIRESMSNDSQILQYAVLKNNVLIWVVSKEKCSAEPQRISIEELNGRVASLRQLLSGGSQIDADVFSRESGYLYGVLIRPIVHLLDKKKQLCIIPDKILNYLPFAALKSPESGEFFIEEQERGFVLSPSSKMFVINSKTAREKQSGQSEKLLSVGDPLINGEVYPDLDPLRSAVIEAEEIGRYYGSQRPFTGASATKKKVMSEMETSDVIHLATHAITDQRYPLRSKLLLARDPARAGQDVIQAYEILKLNLARVKLVVLSACQTAVERDYGGEGMIGLSRPFMARGVPLVVASLWPVESAATSRLMIGFHRHRKMDPLPTAEALRKAQVDMLRSSSSTDSLPRSWAAFVVLGGNATF